MTTDAEAAALLRAVLADPADNAPRYAYADRLDELAGGPGESRRAELIRLQLELSQGIPATIEWIKTGHCPVYEANKRHWFERRQREAALLRAHGHEWAWPWSNMVEVDVEPQGEALGTVRGHVFYWSWDRGFVRAVRGPALPFLTLAAEGFASHPVTRVELPDVRPIRVALGSTAGKWFYPLRHIPPEFRAQVPSRYGVFSDHFDSPREAEDAVSRAAVMWARFTAGLPAVPFPPRPPSPQRATRADRPPTRPDPRT